MKSFISILFLVGVTQIAGEKIEWNYRSLGADWPRKFDTCKGNTQSPINLVANARKYKEYDDFVFTNYDKTGDMVVINTGHTIQVQFADSIDLPTISGGGLIGTYKFAQYHLHWGTDKYTGSEHTENGDSFPLELHLVHLNTKYAEGEHTSKTDGAAVLGIIFEDGTTCGDLSELSTQAANVVTAGTNVTVDTLPTLKDLLPSNTKKFYRYKGSLTTPECNEAVVWTVFKDKKTVAQTQIDPFRDLKDSDSKVLDQTFRVTQVRGNRDVFQTFRK